MSFPVASLCSRTLAVASKEPDPCHVKIRHLNGKELNELVTFKDPIQISNQHRHGATE